MPSCFRTSKPGYASKAILEEFLSNSAGMRAPEAISRRAPSWNMSATGGLTSFIGLDDPAG